MNAPLQFSSAASELMDSEAALADCVDQVKKALGGAAPDVVFLFVSPHHRDAYAFLQETLLDDLKPRHLLGCSGGGIIGEARELEETPGLSITAAVLPGVTLQVQHLGDDDLPGPDDAPRAWETVFGIKAADKPDFITLLSPFMSRAEDMLAGLDYAFPQAHKIGGVVSGLRHVSERALFLDGQRFSDGALVLSLSGDIRVDPLVAQGCRPVGPIFTITSSDRNVILGLDHKPAASGLQVVYDAADSRTRDLLQRALFVGLVGDTLTKEDPQPGDFLIRNVMGLDGKNGSVAVASYIREGMRVQFHVRDGETAAQDLAKVLERFKAENPGREVPGGLLFSCMGRGERLYGEVDHDSQAFIDAFGTKSLGGFFCNGEIGPVGRGTYLHGFTSCFALFSRP